MLETLRRIVTAAGELDEERSRRLAQIERLFGGATARKRPARRAAAAGGRTGKKAR
jgi:hypothetical protein